MNSALYVGWVRHRRHTPVPHAFQYRTFLAYLDLAERDTVFRGRWLWSTRRPAPAWFRRADHVGDPARPLDACVRDVVEARLGFRPLGPVRLLTHLRYWGYVMNPVSFYYCFARDGADRAGRPPEHGDSGGRLEAVVAEVHNTPWGERHCYALDCRSHAAQGPFPFRFPKEFHVSPFMPMEMEYSMRLTLPAESLDVHMVSYRRGAAVFDATLALERRPITTANLAGALARHPFMTGKVIAAIYWQALKLALKGVPYVPHPGARAERPR